MWKTLLLNAVLSGASETVRLWINRFGGQLTPMVTCSTFWFKLAAIQNLPSVFSQGWSSNSVNHVSS
jgi:hypothetical protein